MFAVLFFSGVGVFVWIVWAACRARGPFKKYKSRSAFIRVPLGVLIGAVAMFIFTIAAGSTIRSNAVESSATDEPGPVSPSEERAQAAQHKEEQEHVVNDEAPSPCDFTELPSLGSALKLLAASQPLKPLTDVGVKLRVVVDGKDGQRVDGQSVREGTPYEQLTWLLEQAEDTLGEECVGFLMRTLPDSDQLRSDIDQRRAERHMLESDPFFRAFTQADNPVIEPIWALVPKETKDCDPEDEEDYWVGRPPGSNQFERAKNEQARASIRNKVIGKTASNTWPLYFEKYDFKSNVVTLIAHASGMWPLGKSSPVIRAEHFRYTGESDTGMRIGGKKVTAETQMSDAEYSNQSSLAVSYKVSEEEAERLSKITESVGELLVVQRISRIGFHKKCKRSCLKIPFIGTTCGSVNNGIGPYIVADTLGYEAYVEGKLVSKRYKAI